MFSKTVDIVSYAFLTSECKLCLVCVCSPFQVIRYFYILKFVNWLNS